MLEFVGDLGYVDMLGVEGIKQVTGSLINPGMYLTLIVFISKRRHTSATAFVFITELTRI